MKLYKIYFQERTKCSIKHDIEVENDKLVMNIAGTSIDNVLVKFTRDYIEGNYIIYGVQYMFDC